MKSILRSLDLGNPVAEFDNLLENYFVENEAFNKLIKGDIDVIAGDKGAGKTAIFQIVQKRYRKIPELQNIEIIAGFNPAGSPIFQKIARENVVTEGLYASIWKTYFISLIGHWILDVFEDEKSSNIEKLSKLLFDTGLRSGDNKPETILAKVIRLLKGMTHPKELSLDFTLSENGIPVITPKATFESTIADKDKNEILHEEALELIDKCLEETGFKVWVFLDRLDEAFQGFPMSEIPALRALLRTYLDLLAFKNFRLKLFIRRDLFRKITGESFVNLTHINARKFEIAWDEPDLLNLLCQRIRKNTEAMSSLKTTELSDHSLFYRIFPEKIDQAERKPNTWNWIIARIRDGNNVKHPRNLIDLAIIARDEQLKAESRAPRPFTDGEPLITSESIRAAHKQLSARRVEDTLLAEAGDNLSDAIRKFRGDKAELDLGKLKKILGLESPTFEKTVRQLNDIGFLEEFDVSWKVPMLYRDGLSITQGKSFSSENVDATS